MAKGSKFRGSGAGVPTGRPGADPDDPASEAATEGGLGEALIDLLSIVFSLEGEIGIRLGRVEPHPDPSLGEDFEPEHPLGSSRPEGFLRELLWWSWTGVLLGLLVGAASAFASGEAPVDASVPPAAAPIRGLEGSLLGAALGGLTGVLVGLVVSRDEADRQPSPE